VVAALSSPPDFDETGAMGGCATAGGLGSSISLYRPPFAYHQLLRDLDIERNLFCPLTVTEMDGGGLATRRRLGQSSMVVGASSGGALALQLAPVVEMMSRDSPPSSGSAREALE
jgi:hypothetical protein